MPSLASLLTPLAAAGCLVAVASAAELARSDIPLERELTEHVPDRRALLSTADAADAPATATTKDLSDLAHWSVGDVRGPGGWMPSARQADIAAADARLAQYQSLRDAQPLDAARHRWLADWCREHQLPDQERAHLWAVAAAENSPEVWRRLGFRESADGWMEPLAQQQSRVRQRDEAKWHRLAASLAERLRSSQAPTRATALAELHRITDTAAIPALEAALSFEHQEVATSYVQWLAKQPQVEATAALVRTSVISPWDVTRQLAIDALQQRRLEHVVPPLLAMLSSPYDSFAEQLRNVPASRIVLHQQTFVRELQGVVIKANTSVQLVPVRVRVPGLNAGDVGPYTRVIGRFERQRRAEDFSRISSRVGESSDATLSAQNAAIADWNQRCVLVLNSVTKAGLETPQAWWSWWHVYNSTTPATKPIVEVNEVDERLILVPVPMAASSCLPAGTMVETERGQQPIESIRLGDRVLSKNIDTGELSFAAVLRTTERRAQPLVKIDLGTESIQATRGHHFWVDGLGWRQARELEPGDRLHGVHGTVRVTHVAEDGFEPVYNLIVDRTNTYVVGNQQVLSHDVTFPAPTNTKVPGLTP